MSLRHEIVLLLRELTDMMEGDLQYLAYRLDELFRKRTEDQRNKLEAMLKARETK